MIEFAFCIPVLILMIYYMHDLIKIKRYYSQIEFVAYQTAQMIQAVSQNRENKKITKNDLRRICAAAWQTVYPAKTMHYKENAYENGGYFFARAPMTKIYYVKGLDNGNASCFWRVHIYDKVGFTSPDSIACEISTSDHTASTVRYKANVPPTQIYPKLTIKPGEAKIIVETCIYHNANKEYNGLVVNKKLLSPREALGLYMATPPGTKQSTTSNWSYFFHSVVIFSTTPDYLFDDAGPQD